MAAENAGWSNYAEPGPIDDTVLTQQAKHRSEAIWNGQDLGILTCRSRSSEFSNQEPMVDDRVVNLIKALGLEGLLWVPGREIHHGLITALVERWQPETHTFHMPHGEVSIILQDVELLLGLPVDGDAITGSTQKTWTEVCRDFLGFQPINQDAHKQLTGQRILISRLLEQVAGPLQPNAEEAKLHKYARCYVLALLGDTIFGDKSGDRVHLMWRFEVVLGDTPPQHEYFDWFNRVTRRFIDRSGAKLTMMVSLVNCLLRHHPVGTEDHKDIIDVLTAVHEIDRVQPPIPEAPNEEQKPPSHNTFTDLYSSIDPPHVQAKQVVGLPAVAEGRLKRISKAPPCGTGGHKHGHKVGPEASDEGHARPPPHYTRRRKVQKRWMNGGLGFHAL
ncbi:protein MAIN-LIKE 1-like [Quercus lobata]|uniref:protein MAIN-LIKE 1-like n=1 Tax=Quercus lobata TaxID=97700 RepID=UPI0012485B43|nr:protein MAIN-LIKE 1-like [Quercus lobata]